MPSPGLQQVARDVSTYLILLMIISTLGPLQFGFHLAELNAPQDVISCRLKKPISTRLYATLNSIISTPPRLADEAPLMSAALPDCIPMNDAQYAVVSSMFTLGGLVGALTSGPLASARGRLFAMRLTSVFFALGSAIETLAGSIAVMSVGRVLAGVGAGAATVIVPLYISEVAPPAERGTFGAMTQVSINVGIVLTQTLGYFLSYGSAWRWVLGAGVMIAAAQGVGTLFVPESPAWLAANKSAAHAKQTLQRIRGRHYDIGDEVSTWGADFGVPDEAAALLADDDAERATTTPPSPDLTTAARGGGAPSTGGNKDATGGGGGGGGAKSGQNLGFFEVIRDPFYRPAVIACIGAMASQQLCGINSIIMYSVSLLRDLLPVNSALLTIIISAINLITTLACSPLPDKLGRKTCLLISIVGQGTSSLILALSILFGTQILSAVMVMFFVAFFAVGLGPVPFILASELVGQEAVGATQSWCLGASYVATFLVAQFFPIINVALNARFGGAGWVYFIFTALAVLCGLFVFWRVPESKGTKDADEVWGRTRQVG